MATYGGVTPLLKWESITCEAPAGTTVAAPVLQGELFELSGAGVDDDGSGYKLVACTAGDTFAAALIVMALHRQTEEREIGVQQLSVGSGQRRLLAYTGTAPAIGDGVAISAANVRKVVGTGAAAATNLPRVVRVLTATTEVEVAF